MTNGDDRAAVSALLPSRPPSLRPLGPLQNDPQCWPSTLAGPRTVVVAVQELTQEGEIRESLATLRRLTATSSFLLAAWRTDIDSRIVGSEGPALPSWVAAHRRDGRNGTEEWGRGRVVAWGSWTAPSVSLFACMALFSLAHTTAPPPRSSTCRCRRHCRVQAPLQLAREATESRVAHGKLVGGAREQRGQDGGGDGEEREAARVLPA
jgi:hypothetical protein